MVPSPVIAATTVLRIASKDGRPHRSAPTLGPKILRAEDQHLRPSDMLTTTLLYNSRIAFLQNGSEPFSVINHFVIGISCPALPDFP